MLSKKLIFFFFGFLFLLLCYHGLHTFLVFSPLSFWTYGDVMSKVLILWFLLLLFVALFYRKQTLEWICRHRLLAVAVLGTAIYGIFVSFVFRQTSFNGLVLGLQSSIAPFIFILSAAFIGYIFAKKTELTISSKPIFTFFFIFLTIAIVGGIVWQGAKHLLPEVFSSFGFGPVGDRHPNTPPPLYFRTGPGGFPRLSGLFAGPNNYGYFLVVFLPLVLSFWKQRKKNIRITMLVFLFLISGILTLSRGVLLGRCIIGIGFFLSLGGVSYRFSQQISLLLADRKKNFLSISALGLLLGGFISLSWYKLGSTLAHVSQWVDGFQTILKNPRWGYGLGSSGPGIHYGGIVLPENFFLQLWLDGGVFFLLLRLFCIFLFIKAYVRYDRYRFLVGFAGLLSVGLFLHIFEDTMVNLLVCLSVGFLRGLEEGHCDKLEMTH